MAINGGLFLSNAKEGSKAQMTYDLVLLHLHLSTPDMVQMLINELNLSKQLAQNYQTIALGRVMVAYAQKGEVLETNQTFATSVSNNPFEQQPQPVMQQTAALASSGENEEGGVTPNAPGIPVLANGEDVCPIPHSINPSLFQPNLVTQLSDDDLLQHIRDLFDMLEDVTESVCNGASKGLVVTGNGGLGKSYHVERVTEKCANAKHVKGTMSAVHLYMALYECSEPGHVLVLDDCNKPLFDEESLNILMSAIDTKEKRMVSYSKASKVLEADDIPNQFEMKGSVIVISNVDFQAQLQRNSRVAPLLEALMTRCHYMDVMLRSTREKMVRMRDVIERGGMFQTMGLTPEQADDVIGFIEKHQADMFDLSIRAAILIAEQRVDRPDTWERNCRNSKLMTKGLAALINSEG